MEKLEERFQETSNNKGITLVALVITIIILIILATVAINYAFGDNGLIRMAEEARDLTINSTEYESQAMSNLVSYMNEEIGGIGDSEKPDMPDGWDPDKVTAVGSEDGVIVPVPKGFVSSEAKGEKSVNDGFVIYEGEVPVNDGNVKEAQKSRNQFVWIPVDDESLLEMYTTTVSGQELSKSSLGEETTTTTVYSKLRDASVR